MVVLVSLQTYILTYLIKFSTVYSRDGVKREAEQDYIFSIEKHHVALHKQLSMTEKVCKKIKEMEERRKVSPVKAKEQKGKQSRPNYIIIDDIEPTAAYW